MSEKAYGSRNIGNSKKLDDVSFLKEQLKTKKLKNVYLFLGDEPFLIDHYLGELKKIVLDGDSQSLNLTVFENKLNINKLIDACDTYPVFAEMKMVLVKNSGLFYSKVKKDSTGTNDENESEDSRESKSSDNNNDNNTDKNSNKGTDTDNNVEGGNKSQEAIKKYISDIPETTCLVFVESQVDKRLSLYKQVAKLGQTVELNRLGPGELASWIAKGVRSMKKNISEEAAQYLVTICEPSMYSLKNELLKLCAYTGERTDITYEDVKLMATPTIKSVIFDLLNAVSQKNAAKALKLLSDMFELKEPEQKILAMISKQTGEILKLKMLLSKRASQQQINQYFQGKHPYALKILTQQAQSMDEQYLKKFLKNCMEAETGYKKGLIDVKLSLEVLLGKINS